LHFLGSEERLRTLKEIHRRLKPGAPFVVAHSSFPQAGGERAAWLSRYAAFALTSGSDPGQVHKMRDAVEAHLSLLTPEHDAALLAEAGFSNVTLFYAAFTWRGWVAYA
jgi:tRNA (cmo5U34)-methyltransferase